MVVVAAEETRVPAPLPGILKEYTKAAIRTQPRDLLAWSAAYFKYGWTIIRYVCTYIRDLFV